MRHFASARFWQNFNALPVEIRKAALANFDLLKQNPSHPSLQLKVTGRKLLTSRRATRLGMEGGLGKLILSKALSAPRPDPFSSFEWHRHARFDMDLGSGVSGSCGCCSKRSAAGALDRGAILTSRVWPGRRAGAAYLHHSGRVLRHDHPFRSAQPSHVEAKIPAGLASDSRACQFARCNWPITFSHEDSGGLEDRYYITLTLHARDNGGKFVARNRRTAEADAFFVLRPAEPGKNSRVLLQLATNTYNAYTNWGVAACMATTGGPICRGTASRSNGRSRASSGTGKLRWSPGARRTTSLSTSPRISTSSSVRSCSRTTSWS